MKHTIVGTPRNGASMRATSNSWPPRRTRSPGLTSLTSTCVHSVDMAAMVAAVGGGRHIGGSLAPVSQAPGDARRLAAVSAHRIDYRGPSTFAVSAARLLADADGVELTSSDPPKRLDEELVELSMTVEGGTDEVLHAVASVRGALPDGAVITISA